MDEEQESLAMGSFTAKDGTQKMYVMRGKAADNRKDYGGIILPEQFEVIEPLTEDGQFSPPEIRDDERGYSYRQVDRTAVYKFEMQDGVPRCVSVSLGSPPGLEEIRPDDLRKVQIEAALAAILDFFAGTNAQGFHAYPVVRKAGVELVRKRKRRALTEEVLREVAVIYEDNIDSAPTQAVADHFDIELRTASLRVKRARESGYITKTAKAGRRPHQ
jgi:hypothetical protein